MFNRSGFIVLLFLLFAAINSHAQTTFALLDGNGFIMNPLGWTTNGSSTLLDTGGDADPFPNEMRFTASVNPNELGGVFFNTPMNLANNCNYWEANFNLRAWGGSGADGMTFTVTDAIPTTTFAGGYLGMSGAFNGFSVCFDSYTNCGAPAPKLEIRYNTTDECVAGPEIPAPFRQNPYFPTKVIYNNGQIDVYFNGAITPTLSGFYTFASPTVYFGFTAATGGGTDDHSLKYCRVDTYPSPVANAGTDVTGCSGASANLGATAVVPNTYTWTPITGLSTSTVSNPSLSLSNTGTANTVQAYTVATTLGNCTVNDAVQVTIVPIPVSPTASDVTICSGNTATLGVVGVAGFTYNWYAAAAGGVVLASGTSYTTPVLSAATSYYVSALNGTCEGARTVVLVSVNPTPATPVVSDVTVCAGLSGQLTAVVPAGITVQWYAAATGGVPLASTATYTTTVSGTYYAQATNASSCTSTRAPATLGIYAPLAVPVVPALSICSGATATLNVSAPTANASYSWFASPLGAVALATGTSFTTPALTTNQSYYVEVTSVNGCVQSTRGQANVTIKPLPLSPVVLPDSICPNAVAQLTPTAVSGVSFNWYASATATVPVFTGASYQLNLLATSTFYVEAVLNGCKSTSKTPVEVFVDTPPLAPLAADVRVCKGLDAILVASNVGLIQGFQWTHNSSAVISTNDSVFISPVNFSSTYQVLSLSYYEGCPGAATTLNLEALDPPYAQFSTVPTAPDALEAGELYTFYDQSNTISNEAIVAHQWLFEPNQSSTLESPQYAFSQEGDLDVTLIVTDNAGCFDSVTQIVEVRDIRNAYIPTAFTPNNDGHNDVFSIGSSKNLQSYSMRIFDRWGKMVFEATSIQINWDGLDLRTAQSCPEGVYVYHLRYQLSDGTPGERGGSITLIR